MTDLETPKPSYKNIVAKNINSEKKIRKLQVTEDSFWWKPLQAAALLRWQ